MLKELIVNKTAEIRKKNKWKEEFGDIKTQNPLLDPGGAMPVGKPYTNTTQAVPVGKSYTNTTQSVPVGSPYTTQSVVPYNNQTQVVSPSNAIRLGAKPDAEVNIGPTFYSNMQRSTDKRELIPSTGNSIINQTQVASSGNQNTAQSVVPYNNQTQVASSGNQNTAQSVVPYNNQTQVASNIKNLSTNSINTTQAVPVGNSYGTTIGSTQKQIRQLTSGSPNINQSTSSGNNFNPPKKQDPNFQTKGKPYNTGGTPPETGIVRYQQPQHNTQSKAYNSSKNSSPSEKNKAEQKKILSAEEKKQKFDKLMSEGLPSGTTEKSRYEAQLNDPNNSPEMRKKIEERYNRVKQNQSQSSSTEPAKNNIPPESGSQQPKGNSQAGSSVPPKNNVPPEKGFNEAFNLDKIQKGWQSGVEGTGGALKQSLQSLSNKFLGTGFAAQGGAGPVNMKNLENLTGVKGALARGATSAFQHGGVFDKAVGAIGKHGLKGLAAGAGILGAGALAKGVGGIARYAVNNAGVLPTVAAGAAGLAHLFGKPDLGNQISSGLKTFNKTMKGANMNIEQEYIMRKVASQVNDYIPDGYKSIEDTELSEKKASVLPKIKSEAELMELLGDSIPLDVREKIWQGFSQLRRRDNTQRALELGAGTALGVVGGIASNILTDNIRQVTGNPNRPQIVIATPQAVKSIKANNRMESNIKEASELNTLSQAIEDGIRAAHHKDFLESGAEKLHKFVKLNPKLSPYLAGMGTMAFGPGLVNQLTGAAGSGYNFLQSQYNNLNYGYNAGGYGNPYGYGGYYGY